MRLLVAKQGPGFCVMSKTRAGCSVCSLQKRLGAIHAQPPHVLVVLVQNNRELVFGLPVFGRYRIVVAELVFLSARRFALFAIDAERGVVQQSLAHQRISKPLRDRTSASAASESRRMWGCGVAAVWSLRRGCACSLPNKGPGSASVAKPGRAVPCVIAEGVRRSLEPEELPATVSMSPVSPDTGTRAPPAHLHPGRLPVRARAGWRPKQNSRSVASYFF